MAYLDGMGILPRVLELYLYVMAIVHADVKTSACLSKATQTPTPSSAQSFPSWKFGNPK